MSSERDPVEAAELKYDGGTYGLTPAEIEAERKQKEAEAEERREWNAWELRKLASSEGESAKRAVERLRTQLTENDQNYEDLLPIIRAACQRDTTAVGDLFIELVVRMSNQLNEGT